MKAIDFKIFKKNSGISQKEGLEPKEQVLGNIPRALNDHSEHHGFCNLKFDFISSTTAISITKTITVCQK